MLSGRATILGFGCVMAGISILISGCSAGEDPAVNTESVAETSQALSAGRVIAYVDGTVGTISTAGLDATKYTHINYAFANLDANGNVYFTYPAQDTTNLNNIKALKNTNPNLKVLVSVGGWTWSNNFSIVAGDANKRTTMVNSIWSLVNNNGIDGIDIDWEWPGWQGEGDNAVCAGTCDGDRIVSLMQAIWNARGSKLVTMAGGAHPNMGAYVNLGALSNYVHFLNIMTYDFHGPWETAWAPHANLYGGDISVDSAVNMYLNEGFPANKLVVGIPFYGKAWGISDPSPLYRNISCSGTHDGASCSVNGQGGHTLHYDTAKQAAYIDGLGHYISYDNLVSVGWKTSYINNRNLGGAMYWSALQDSAGRDLTNKIWADIGAAGGGGASSGARVFDGGDNNAASPAEWDSGYWKGSCSSGSVITGLSQHTNLSSAHAILCAPNSTFTGNLAATVYDVSNGDHRRASRLGDWDYGYAKSECGVGEYVSGISMSPSTKRLHALRCASASMANGGQNNCETRLVTQDDRGDGAYGDWDSGYFKAQCSAGKVVFGVSANSNGSAHRILCCSF
jgi:chitinase